MKANGNWIGQSLEFYTSPFVLHVRKSKNMRQRKGSLVEPFIIIICEIPHCHMWNKTNLIKLSDWYCKKLIYDHYKDSFALWFN